MTAKPIPATRFDALEREAFKTMIESEPFQAYIARLKAELARAEETLLRGDTRRQIHRAQGAAGAMGTAIALPARILEEMNAKKS